MWLTSSSIGRKFVMALTGICLVLFVTFHVLMNAVALIWPAAYNQVCEFLGANWYALIASAGLAVLFILHIIYALWLTIQNRAARGNDRYLVTTRPPQVEWASKNMLVLGIVVLAFLVVHLIQFWAKMQWQELRHAELAVLPQLEGVPAAPSLGTLFIEMAFKQVWTPIVYIIGFVALWFHMNHGFWSMFHSIGWDNNIWIGRLKKIGCWWTTIVIGLFIAQAIVFTVLARQDYYTKNGELQEQYAEFWGKQAEAAVTEFRTEANKAFSAVEGDPMGQQEAQVQFVTSYGPGFVERANTITEAYDKQCPDAAMPESIQSLKQLSRQISQMMTFMAPATQAADNASANQ
ncbi:MAG: succinate dehydrogenase cytochrome b subunit [Bacteroidales bacterium]|nr:succinate dehydrogenase cytochrome b subunit [Bacteroidales bacterium]